jgi:hypothetical protein
MLGFKNFRSAPHPVRGGVELMHMIAKGQMEYAGSQLPPFAQFYSLLA